MGTVSRLKTLCNIIVRGANWIRRLIRSFVITAYFADLSVTVNKTLTVFTIT